jgi:AcrR family transcriptional regulator
MAIKRENNEVRQQQIAEAARKVLFDCGSQNLTVKKIAAEVGISDAALYRHFKSKKDIIYFLLAHIEEALLTDILRSREDHGSLALDAIESTIRRHFSAIDRRKGVYFQVIAEIISLGDKRLNKKALVTISKYIDGLRDLLAEGVKRGDIRNDIDLDAAAKLLFGLVQGVVNLWTLHDKSFSLSDTYTSLWQVYRESLIRR